ncbi:hypothetical protein G7Y89_g7676 [Cudoniella acicularis]|uniref:Protein NO VEIN C-terminal domain-containing protein n=1 Tax=Cudoniella acicularis TaxID=354080 RepID=A0A8H4W1R0_9HELO|nr:hypothetical protein G7Y89_g7676 [Cudoniella acicularis]
MDLQESPRDLIERIAARNGVLSEAITERARYDPLVEALLDSNRNLKRIAKNSIVRLAEELNSVPTHFVLECIQNADDNHYPEGIEPFLRIIVRSDRIQLDCNETRFNKDNVEAICNVGKSTKSFQGGYIGEKGIGFKSVFKVAQHAHIYSPPFSFKFDKNEELGMITPIWIEEEHALHRRHEECQTTILLLPPTGQDFSGLFENFDAIAPTLLLFLRKLKRLELNLTDPPIRKEGRRRDVTSTEISLAFPINSEGAPEISTQMVHAFLPVRDFGFKFLIQADFLVTSSRQDIDESKSWNHELSTSISRVFEQAILHFLSVANDPLRYTWLRYLPQGISHEFWRLTVSRIWRNVKRLPVLESWAGDLCVPETLERLSNIALDRGGRPLVGALSEYLSPRYADADMDILSELGVKTYSQEMLLTRLYRMEDEVLIRKVPSWHEDLARCMESFERTQAWNDLADYVRDRKLIPLDDGSWSSAHDLETNPIYFREGNSTINIPSDVNLRLVKTEASANIHRKRFFGHLGVKNCNEREVAELILRKHHSNQPPPLQDAVIHLKYIFMLPPSIRDSLDISNFWLYDESGRHAKGDKLYIHDNARYSATDLLRGGNVSAEFLSSEYGTSNVPSGARREFIQWLLNNTALTTIPRIKRAGDMSPEFSYILRHHSNKVINILRCHWQIYQNDINENIRAVLANHPVNCSDGGDPVLRPIKHSYLPDPRLQQKSSELCTLTPGVEFIVIEDYSPIYWAFLTNFCAGNAPDLRFYLWVGLQAQFRQGCDIIHAKKLLQYISEAEVINGENRALMRSTFSTDKLLRVIKPRSSNEVDWAYPRNCVWDAPAGFRSKFSLKPLYSDHIETKTLIKRTLDIRDATIREVVTDMILERASDSYLMAAYKYLAAKLVDNAPQTDLDFLRQNFEQHTLILIPRMATRLLLSQCVWGGPAVSHKTNIQSYYNDSPTLHNFFTSPLNIKGPSWDDVFRELNVLKSDSHTTASQVGAIYEYLFSFELLSEVRNAFEENNLVYTKETDGTNRWRKPSQCVWTAPSFLRSKVAISDTHMGTTPLAIAFLRTNLNIKSAGLMDFVEDVRILNRGGACDRNEIENLYRRIEFNVDRRQSELRTIFTSERLIYDHLSVPPRWVLIDQCVWTGPRCLHTTPKLARCYPALEILFCTILGVRNATSDNIVQELLAVVNSVPGYSNSPLLDEASHHRITQLLLGLKPLELSRYARNILASQRIWPYRAHGDAVMTLVFITNAFFIPDHQHFLDVLDNSIPILYFSSSNVTALKPLLLMLGLESKLLSRSVTHIDSAEDTSMPDVNLSNDLRVRADALFYCGGHFRVNRLASSRRNLRQLLRGIQVYRASDISTTYELNSQGVNKTATRSGLMRLSINNNQLHLFVPRDQDSQREAFAYCLAKKMIEFLDIPERESWQIISGIFTTPIDRLESSLYTQGILLPIEDEGSASTREISSQQVEEQESYEEQRQGSPTLSSNQSSMNDARRRAHAQASERNLPLTPSAPLRNRSINSNNGQASASGSSNIPIESGNRHNALAREGTAERETNINPANERSSGAPTSNQIREALNGFQARVDNVIRQGRTANTTAFRLVANGPRHVESIAPGRPGSLLGPETLSRDSSTTLHGSPPEVTFDLATLASALPAATESPTLRSQSSRRNNQDAPSPEAQARPARRVSGRVSSGWSAPRNNLQRARDFGIGFLGEQFVVEALKQHLPDFNELLHWTSTLRIHAGFSAYTRRERTDLTYCDTNGHLRRLLRRWADEDMPAWLEADVDIERPITFWLEVKTTTEFCETPFYVSSAQYALMRDMAVSSSHSRDVYVLLRVYNIEGVPGVRVYIDPWTRAQEGQLDFVASTWVVTPRG